MALGHNGLKAINWTNKVSPGRMWIDFSLHCWLTFRGIESTSPWTREQSVQREKLIYIWTNFRSDRIVQIFDAAMRYFRYCLVWQSVLSCSKSTFGDISDFDRIRFFTFGLIPVGNLNKCLVHLMNAFHWGRWQRSTRSRTWRSLPTPTAPSTGLRPANWGMWPNSSPISSLPTL